MLPLPLGLVEAGLGDGADADAAVVLQLLDALAEALGLQQTLHELLVLLGAVEACEDTHAAHEVPFVARPLPVWQIYANTIQ